MGRSKKPYIPIYTGDYIKDTRSLSLAAKGAWSDLIFLMWAQETGGIMEGDIQDFARMIGGSEEETEKVLLELCMKKICDREEVSQGRFKIICRRLVKESQISAIRAEVGSKGASKREANKQAKSKQKSDIDNDIDNDIGIEKIKRSEVENDVPRETIQLGPKPLTDDEFEPLSEEWFSKIFDELELERKRMAYRDHDIPDQLQKFKSKVRGSPGDYIYRDTAGVRNAFDYQLRTTNPQKKYAAGENKQQRNTAALVAGFAKRYGSDAPEG